jgi:O-antigen ligase
LGALAAVLVTVGNVPLFERFANTGSELATANGRTYLWHALLQYFDPTQLNGYGLGAGQALLTHLQIGTNGELNNGLVATAPSNLFIGTLYDQGIIGLALLISAFVVLAGSLIAGIRAATGDRRVLFAMSILMLINALIQSIDVDDLLSLQPAGTYFWIMAALPFAAHWSPSREVDKLSTVSRRWTEAGRLARGV